jgi:SAM-dependent methyltransferase
MTKWHQDDNFWETTAPIMFFRGRLDSTSAEVDGVLELLELKSKADILDLCCGIGRHSLELSRRGFSVTGVDRTEAYLRQAREQARNENLTVDFIQEDMREFCRPYAFDAALSLFTSFGYFEDQTENLKVLENIHRSLRENGRLLIDIMGKEILARRFQERDWEERDGVIILQERRISKDWTRVENRWTLIRGDQKYEFDISHWIYSASELTALLKEAGFSSVQVYGDWQGSSYDHQAKRLIIAVVK